MAASDKNLTGVLRDWAAGSPEAGDRVFERLYDELRILAQQQLLGERPGHTIQPTALVNEAYLKLKRGSRIDWQDRAHFFAIASRIIRQILVDHARARNALRRGGGLAVTLDENLHGAADDGLDLLALDDALRRLESLNEGQAEVVALRYFGGLTIEEVARATEQSESTVVRQWRAARAWLYQNLPRT